MRVSRRQYQAALTATKMEKECKANSPSQTTDIFSMEWKKATNTEANAKGSLLGLDKDESGSIAEIMQVQVGNANETPCWQEFTNQGKVQWYMNIGIRDIWTWV